MIEWFIFTFIYWKVLYKLQRLTLQHFKLRSTVFLGKKKPRRRRGGGGGGGGG